MTVITGNKLPYHLQLAREIEGRIRKGIYDPGEMLPSVRMLGREFEVSVNVVQRAIRCLEQRSVVVTHPGKGVQVAMDHPELQSAILFGLIQPFPSTLYFEQQVLLYAEQAFSARANLLVTRSSEFSSRREVEIAKHFFHNGVQGILLWSTERSDSARFFEKLSQQVPVVLVDRLLGESDLPAVVIDTYNAGRDIVRTVFGEYKRSRVLVLNDDLDISPYHDLQRGMSEAATELDRHADITFVQMSISQLIHEWGCGDYSKIEGQRQVLARLLKEGDYDTLFCQQEDFIDYLFVQTGLIDAFPSVQLVSITAPGGSSRSLRYCQSGVLRWVYDFPKMIRVAAEKLQTAVFDRACPTGIDKISAVLHDTGNSQNKGSDPTVVSQSRL